MPLHDHFHPPLTNSFSWEEVHGGWPMVIVQQLSKLLPERYTAGPRVHLGPQFEGDVASYESNRQDRPATSDTLAIPLDLEASYEKTCRDLRLAS